MGAKHSRGASALLEILLKNIILVVLFKSRVGITESEFPLNQIVLVTIFVLPISVFFLTMCALAPHST